MMRYAKHLFIAALVLVVVGVSARFGLAGLDMIQGHMIPSTLTNDYTLSGANTFSGAVTMTSDLTVDGTTTLAGALSCSDVQTFDAGFNSPGFSVDASGNLNGTGYWAHGADAADAGAIRLSNADYVLAEASAAGTDISVIGVDSSEVVQIGASGASGVTITPALTVTGGLVGPKIAGHVITTGTAPTATAGTVATTSTDHAGMITSVGATETIVSFASAYTAEPACVATAEEAVWITGKSTAGFTITASGNIDDVSFVCFELE